MDETSSRVNRMASASVGCNAAIQRSLPGAYELTPPSGTTAVDAEPVSPPISEASKSHASCSESSCLVIVIALSLSSMFCRSEPPCTHYRTNVRFTASPTSVWRTAESTPFSCSTTSGTASAPRRHRRAPRHPSLKRQPKAYVPARTCLHPHRPARPCVPRMRPGYWAIPAVPLG